jgi:hydrogenase maturation protease
MKPVVVLGIGNTLLRDEGAGVRVVEALRDGALPEEVDLVDGGTGGADLVESIAGRRKVIVADAVKMDGPPGGVVRFTGDDLTAGVSPALSLHDVGLLDALRMAGLLGCAPDEVVVFGIIPKEVRFGLGLSEEVRRALPRVVEAIRKEWRSGVRVANGAAGGAAIQRLEPGAGDRTVFPAAALGRAASLALWSSLDAAEHPADLPGAEFVHRAGETFLAGTAPHPPAGPGRAFVFPTPVQEQQQRHPLADLVGDGPPALLVALKGADGYAQRAGHLRLGHAEPEPKRSQVRRNGRHDLLLQPAPQ